MDTVPLYPLKLQPALHVKVWGGRKLATLMNKTLPTAEPYGESWEVHDSALVLNGALRSESLGELTRRYGAELIGKGERPDGGFPLLAKLLDADEWLSIQVHPNDRQARELENAPRGKTEAWVVLQAEAGAKLVIGLQPGTSREEIAEAIGSGQLEDFLVYAEVKAGDVLYIPANTVHALGPGILLYEIQQSSDITYRLYDWGRMGLDGQPRDLHIDEGLQVANLESLPKVRHPDGDLLVDGEFFCCWRHRLEDSALRIETEGGFQALTCIAGRLHVEANGCEAIELGKGETGLVPACIREFTIYGAGAVLRSCEKSIL